MNFVRGLRGVVRLGSCLVKTTRNHCNAAANQPKSILASFFIGNAPVSKPRLEISDPLTGILGEISIPAWRQIADVSLPKRDDAEPKEAPQPTGRVEKRAARLIVIRRRKMKKHKWRKLQKRMKYVYAKKRQKKELKKEKEFQAVLLSKIKDAEKFDAEEYVASRIKTAHWEKPITRVRGYFAPDWVIRDHLRSQEEEKRVKDRIEYCLRMKK